MKKMFYHMKGEANTYASEYDDDATIAQMKSDCRCNGCVMDAVYNSVTDTVALYSKRLSKSDVYGNLR